MKPKRFFFHQPQVFGMPLRCGVPLVLGFMVFITGLDAEAGDILRGGAGGGGGGKPRAGTNGGNPTPAATDAARANARDMLARTNRTLDSMRAMQNAARNAAGKGANNLGRNPANPTITLPRVPNGLVNGGLKISPLVPTDPTKWTGAKLPKQTVDKGKTKVTIKQTEQQALLSWETFNIGKDTTLTFDQSKGGENVGQWIAFNKVSDPSANPTQILGDIKADGQVYLINPNGIIFGGSSQVNARGLTVSSLPINENLIERGLLNNPDAQFLFSGLEIPAGANGTPGFTPEAPLATNGKYGDVIVQKGAILESSTNAAKVGGRITLAGPNVTNQGTILTPDGQTILAAGLQVGFAAHSGSDPSLRGLDTYIGSIVDAKGQNYAGSVIQKGIIQAKLGDITLAGAGIEQLGFLDSSTSVSLNGRIDLLAHFNAIANPNFNPNAPSTGNPFLYQNSGSVELGLESVIRILPESDSKETTIGTQLALRSQVNIAGKTIHLGRDSTLLAPNALVDISAGEWLFTGGANSVSRFVQSVGQVYFDEGAIVTVAGSVDAVAPVSKNIISVDLRGAELADSPLQRDGLLRNSTIKVDIRDQGIYQGEMWAGTLLADISGFANLIERTASELTVAGGTVNISAGGSMVMRSGSKIDVSGGLTRFEAGSVQTTQLITGGRLVDISTARPDVVYDGIYDGTFTVSNPKFGVERIYNSAIAPLGMRFALGSTEGAAGGKLSITSPSMALDGKLAGRTIVGEKQRLSPPDKSSLNLAFLAQDTTYGSLPLFSPAPPVITFRPDFDQATPADFGIDVNGNPLPLAPERKEQVYLSSKLMSGDGFGILAVNNPDGEIIVPDDVTIKADAGGEIAFTASNITIDGAILSPAGKISFNSSNLSLSTINKLENTSGATLPAPVAGRGLFLLGSTGIVSTEGLLVDERLTAEASVRPPLFLDGGTISINAYSAELSQGGTLDVSGGASVDPRGAVSYGDGGSLLVSTGRDLDQRAVIGGHLQLGAILRGYSGDTAGNLTLQAPAFQIDGSSSNPAVNVIASDFFSEGGFGSYSLTGVGLASGTPGEFVTGMFIAPEASVRPVVTGLLAITGGGKLSLRTVTREEGGRAPGSLSFGALGGNDSFSSTILGRGDVVLAKGASIRTDAKGSVSFTGDTVTLLGSVTSPGGTISVAAAARFPSINQNILLPTALVGNSAFLSTAGKRLLIENAAGLRQGTVLAGGSISISGNIVAERGATIDVSGASGILDLPPTSKSLDPAELNSFRGKTYVPVRVDSNGGRIILSGSRMLYSDADLIGTAGGSSAIGGSVTASSGRFVEVGTPFNTSQTNLIVRQNGLLVPEGFVELGVGTPLTDSTGTPLAGIGNFNVSKFSQGGFDSLALNGNVAFEGDVSLRAPGSLRISSGGVISAAGTVDLKAAYINLGQAFAAPALATEAVILFTQTDSSGNISPYTFSPVHGTGDLTVKADLIDIGNLSLAGIGEAGFLAGEGDIRGNGTLSASGNLAFTAGVIYPTTAGSFNVFAYDHTSAGRTVQGSISVAAGSDRPLPLSAGGELGLFASRIVQGGTLRAPIGTINLGWDGTGGAPLNPIVGNTSASPVTGLLRLDSGGLVSVSAKDPFTGEGAIIPFGISLDGNSWIDPAGNDITVGGVPGKSVNLSGANLATRKGSIIDIDGGGDLYAYRWIPGSGGTKDVLGSNGSFAVIPGYSADYAPYAPFNGSPSATNLGGEAGYVNSTLKVGDQITLAASKDLPSGTYTLLPARYALLPGAFLVTPQSGSPVNMVKAPEGTRIVSGYRSNGLDPTRSGPTLIARFEVASEKIVRDRSEYQDLLANKVLRDAAIAREFTVPRLPVDAGYLSFSSNGTMALRGAVASATSGTGRGSSIDINSSGNILINQSGTGGNAGELVLSSRLLNSFGAESLLVGGIRNFGPGGSQVTVNTGTLTLDNAGSTLRGTDVILVADEDLKISRNSKLRGIGSGDTPDLLIFGDANTPGSGNGLLARVSGNTAARVVRNGVGASTVPSLLIGGAARISGGSVILDSTSGTHINATSRILGDSVSLSSGQISIVLKNPGALNPTAGLVLSGDTLTGLQDSAETLSLLSYSSLDIYGTGTVGSRGFEGLALQTASIRGFNTGNGTVTFSAKNLRIENTADRQASTPLPGPLAGNFELDADEIVLGTGAVRFDGFKNTLLTTTDRILVSEEGNFSTAGALTLSTPFITGESASKYRIAADGLLAVKRSGASTPVTRAGGLGALITLEGGRVSLNSDVYLPSGGLIVRATSGDIEVGNLNATNLDLKGTATRLLDLTRFTSGGTLQMISENGDVRIGSSAVVDVSANKGGGDAGTIKVEAAAGIFNLAGSINGSAGDDGRKAGFTLDVGSLAGGSLASLDEVLNAGSFTDYRDFRFRTGDIAIDGPVRSGIYRVATDAGDIVVSDAINASGETGGVIDLKANGSLVLRGTALLNASGADFDSAGKGGAIVLEAGNQRNGAVDARATLDMRAGSRILLGVASGGADSEMLGRFTGTLHLRAPRTAPNSDVAIEAIGSSISGASSILVEGVKLYGLTGTGTITSTVQTSIRDDANAFLGSSGSTTAGYTAMRDRLTALQPGLELMLAPGAEIYNPNGSLTLGTTSSTSTSDWNLADLRFGPLGTAGVLTLRASENITFFNAISDGFSGGTSLWLAPLMANNQLLPENSQSWSFRFTAGADLTASSYRETLAVDDLADTAGFIKLGKNRGSATATGGRNATTASIMANSFQVIRTGSGDIDIQAGRSIQLLNPFATIYTAGTQVADPSTIFRTGDFTVPILSISPPLSQTSLGAAQQIYPAQYSMAGGNVTLLAGQNIERKTQNNSGLIDDSSRQLPNNWLYRRGYVGPDGQFGEVNLGTATRRFVDPAASTSWWIDFSNFFQSVGALGGGNVTMDAGRDVRNVDAVIPTNARAPMGRPDPATLVELGGGDLFVRSGNDIDGGVYYVERGHGILAAGGSITTNGTRSPSFGLIANLNNPNASILDPLTWIPTILFAGKSDFDVSARGDVLIGPTYNPYLLPTGLNSKFWYKTYFNTFSAESATVVTSLGGDVTLRNAVTLPTRNTPTSILRAWYDTQQLLGNANTSSAWSQPWLRLGETAVDPFSPVLSLSAPNLSLSALSGDVNLAGELTLFPSPTGQLELVANESISGLQPTGLSTSIIPGKSTIVWSAANVSQSDANPASVPGVLTPLNYFSIVGDSGIANTNTSVDFMGPLASLFIESGSFSGSNATIQVRQARHTPGGLHRDDDEPVRAYAVNGDISGLTLFTPKFARVLAARDITDFAFYIQNVAASDTSIITSGRDLIPSNSGSQSRALALSEGNSLAFGQQPLAGDIQISGPGTLQVLAGRDLNLGLGANNPDGTGTGITSIGNLRNPFLGVRGADLIVGAGIGPAASLGTSQLDTAAFINDFVTSPDGREYLDEIAPGVNFEKQSSEEQARLALEVFYLILRDTGRNFNDPKDPGYQKYDSGFSAIKSLFPETVAWEGQILTQSRDIRTRSGGDISIFTPGDAVTMAETSVGNPLAPPGIITESGGGISIFADQSVSIGIGRIFTLRGGDVMIWSYKGDIAAGSSSRTVQSAPPTRVVIDPQSASVETDLAGLATGGGIGVLATVEGVSPGDVDLIAPTGEIDAGDAGIRVSGNINLAAVTVVNAGNISASGSSTGAPATTVSAPSISVVTSASNATAATSSTTVKPGDAQQPTEAAVASEEPPSLYTVEVIGYGGGPAVEEEEEEEKEEEKTSESNDESQKTP